MKLRGIHPCGVGNRLSSHRPSRLFARAPDYLSEYGLDVTGVRKRFLTNPQEKSEPCGFHGEVVTSEPQFENRDWANAFRSLPQEYDYEIETIDGQVPSDLVGTLFRNGPGLFFRGNQKYSHMLDGDGMICRFTFAPGGIVRFKNRFVRTAEYRAEESANDILYRNTFGTQRAGGPIRNAFDIKLKNPANTAVLHFGGRLFALWEAGVPYEIDPNTLQTYGASDFLGLAREGIAPSTTGVDTLDYIMGFGSAVTAHPHVVVDPFAPSEETLITWSWKSKIMPGQPARLQISIREFDGKWGTQAEAKLELEDSPFNPHDFGVSESFYVFAQPPMKLNLLPYLLGFKGPAQVVEFKEGNTLFHLVPRPGSNAAAHFAEKQRREQDDRARVEEERRVLAMEQAASARAARHSDSASPADHFASTSSSSSSSSFPSQNPKVAVGAGAASMTFEYKSAGALPLPLPDFTQQLSHISDQISHLPQQISDQVSQMSLPANPFAAEPRGAAGDPTVISLADEPCFLIHHANCFDDITGEVVLLSTGWDPEAVRRLAKENPRDGILGSWDSMLRGDFSEVPVTKLWEHRLDPEAGTVRSRVLHGRSMDHPKVNPLFAGRRNRYIYYSACARDSEEESAPPQCYIRHDLFTGEKQTWYAGNRCFVEELIFVPRSGSLGPYNGAAGFPLPSEDSGYLLGMTYDAASYKSSLVILDAADFTKGPICRLYLKHHVPHGLHGTWTDSLYPFWSTTWGQSHRNGHGSGHHGR